MSLTPKLAKYLSVFSAVVAAATYAAEHDNVFTVVWIVMALASAYLPVPRSKPWLMFGWLSVAIGVVALIAGVRSGNLLFITQSVAYLAFNVGFIVRLNIARLSSPDA